MKLHRIYGITLRYLFLFRHSINRVADAFYWPVIDLLLWGLTITYVRSANPGSENFVMVVISGLLLWMVVWRGQYEITICLLEDLWNKNLINIFTTPLKLNEWIFSVVILGVIKAFISLIFASIVALILYQVKILFYGFYLLPFIVLLFMTGWWVGFFVAGIILRYGTKLEQLAWSTIYLISPFSGIYYPVSILPVWAQKVSYFIPTSYIFEGSREVIQKGRIVDPSKLWICLILNLVYLAISLIFLKKSYNKVLENKGLVNVF